MKLTLPYPPAVSRYWTTVVLPTPVYKMSRNQNDLRISTFPSPEAKKYKQHVRETFEKMRARNPLDSSLGEMTEPFRGEVEISIRFYPPSRPRAGEDPRTAQEMQSRIKILLDALQGFAYKDSRQIVKETAERAGTSSRPRVEIEITPREIEIPLEFLQFAA